MGIHGYTVYYQEQWWHGRRLFSEELVHVPKLKISWKNDKKHHALESFETSKVVTVMTIDCNLLLPSRSNLKYKIDPPKAAPAAIMQGTSFDQHVNSIKSRPCTNKTTHIFTSLQQKCPQTKFQYIILFLPCPSVKNTLGVVFSVCAQTVLGQKGKVTKVENVQKLVGIGQLVVGPLLNNGDRLAKWKHPEIWNNGNPNCSQ